ncbi:ArdC-like ssDNA-binding domain-containing protein, partial [Mycoplasma sp. HS2188]
MQDHFEIVNVYKGDVQKHTFNTGINDDELVRANARELVKFFRYSDLSPVGITTYPDNPMRITYTFYCDKDEIIGDIKIKEFNYYSIDINKKNEKRINNDYVRRNFVSIFKDELIDLEVDKFRKKLNEEYPESREAVMDYATFKKQFKEEFANRYRFSPGEESWEEIKADPDKTIAFNDLIYTVLPSIYWARAPFRIFTWGEVTDYMRDRHIPGNFNLSEIPEKVIWLFSQFAGPATVAKYFLDDYPKDEKEFEKWWVDEGNGIKTEKEVQRKLREYLEFNFNHKFYGQAIKRVDGENGGTVFTFNETLYEMLAEYNHLFSSVAKTMEVEQSQVDSFMSEVSAYFADRITDAYNLIFKDSYHKLPTFYRTYGNKAEVFYKGIEEEKDDKVEQQQSKKEDMELKKPDEDKQDKSSIDLLIEKSSAELDEYFNSEEKMKEYLDFISGFANKYSFKNMNLIKSQMEGAAIVKSFTEWKKEGVSIKAGQKGLKILAPNEMIMLEEIDEQGNI